MIEARSFRFARNISWSLLGQFSSAALNILLLPALIQGIGIETYGLYIILQSMSSYLLLASLGAGAAGVKFISQLHAERNRQGIADAVRLTFVFFAVGVAAAAAALWIAAPFVLDRVFRIPPHLRAPGLFVLRCAAVGSIFLALVQAAGQVLQGLQRFDLHNLLLFLQSGLAPTGSVLLIRRGFGIEHVAAWTASLYAGTALLALCFVAWALAPLRRLPDHGRLSTLAFAKLGLTQALASAGWIVSYQFDKIFISREISLAGLTLYAVPAGLLQRLQLFPALLSSVVMPMLSELGPDDRESLRRIYLKSVRLVLWIMLLPLIVLFSVMPQFLSLWLGGEFGDASVWPARLLVIGQCIGLVGAIPGTVALARGKYWYASASSWGQAALSLIAWRLLIPKFGLVGAAWGAVVAQAIPALLYAALAHRRIIGLSVRDYVREALLVPGLSAVLTLAAVFPLHAAADGWGEIALLSIFGAAVFYVSTAFLMNREDRQVLRRYLSWEPGL